MMVDIRQAHNRLLHFSKNIHQTDFKQNQYVQVPSLAVECHNRVCKSLRIMYNPLCILTLSPLYEPGTIPLLHTVQWTLLIFTTINNEPQSGGEWASGLT